jgi:hypothetical protein
VQKRLIEQMEKRLSNSPNLRAELMYVPAIHSLLTRNKTLCEFTLAALHELPVAEKWYQVSLIAIEKIFITYFFNVKEISFHALYCYLFVCFN